jgi:hypothetical protein
MVELLKTGSAVHLGSETLAELISFHSGFNLGIHSSKAVSSDDVDTREFSEWLKKKYKIEGGSVGAYSVIRLVTPNESAAYALFFTEFGIYSGEKKPLELRDLNSNHNQDEVVALDKSLEEIHRRPLLFIPYKSVTLLKAFINGAYASSRLYNISLIGPDLNEFGEWLRRKQFINGSHSYDRILLFSTFGNEASAFDNFFNLLEEYRSERLNPTS